MKETVGKGTANAFVEESEQESNLVAFLRQPIGIAFAVALDEPVGSHLAQNVTQLGESVIAGLDTETGKDYLVSCAVRHPPILVPACSSTSISRIIRVS